jgi:hypothetical protein
MRELAFWVRAILLLLLAGLVGQILAGPVNNPFGESRIVQQQTPPR